MKVLIIDPEKVVFEGEATSIILPGEQGVFEILPHHKRIVSRLLTGSITLDAKTYPIRRGLVAADQDEVTIIMEK